MFQVGKVSGCLSKSRTQALLDGQLPLPTANPMIRRYVKFNFGDPEVKAGSIKMIFTGLFDNCYFILMLWLSKELIRITSGGEEVTE